MRRMLTVVMGVMLVASAAAARAQGDAQATSADEWGKLVAANNLNLKGNSPFHLEIAFQIYDMDGKAMRGGTVEDWWAGPGSERVLVLLAGVNEDGSLAPGASHELVRDRYLVDELLKFAVHPVPEEPAVAQKVKNERKTFGKIQLDCLGPETRDDSGQMVQWESVCMQPQKELVLVRLGSGDEIMTRQSTGKFHDTDVALKLRLAYMGRNAIVGEVTRLQSFDASKPEVKWLSLSPEEEATPNGPMYTEYVKGIVPGKPTGMVEPKLPD